ncbi:MAG TPA: GH25 family lysozyme [Haliangium sp.]|nr:GH25 family lysozyme [Haliangium sp.]
MIVGVDYASVDGNRPPIWIDAKRACAEQGSSLGFVVFRGAWGTFADPVIGRDWVNAGAAGLVRGAYLYLRLKPDIVAKMSPEDQVHAFADNVGALYDEDLIPTIDVEDTAASPAVELDLVSRAWEAMRSIYRAAPMIYTSARVWKEDLKNLPAGAMRASPLWLAKPWPWPTHAKARLDPTPFAKGELDPAVPPSWGDNGNWWVHQYQGDAFPMSGFTNTVDLNRFHVMRQGERGDRVKWVQRRIFGADSNHYCAAGNPTDIDGVFGPSTLAAVKTFQTLHLLAADGVIGPKTFAALSWVDAPAV